MRIGQFNARGPHNDVENWFDLIYDQLIRQGHEVRQFSLRHKHPSREDVEWMDFALYHFSQVALYFRRLGVSYCILPSTNDCLPDRGAKLKIAASHPLCKFVTAQSYFHLKKYKEWNIPRPKVYVPMPARTKFFKRKRFSYDRILAGGRLIPKKGLDRIVGKVPNLTIFGDGPLRQELEDLAFKWGNSTSTKFVGWLDEFRLKELMEESWLFLCPSIVTNSGDSEGVPNILKEVSLMNLQIISSPVGGIPEMKGVFLLDDWSHAGIRQAIKEIPRQKNIIAEKYVRELYSPKNCIDKLLKGIEDYANIT